MNEDFFKDRARAVRDLADKADPFTRKRLLELAAKYEVKPRRPTPLPSISARKQPHREDSGDNL
jgi:hypothetical protein